MATLKETKGRINSVKGTLKITSAMKLVASAKLLSAERAVRSLLPYRDTLSSMLQSLQASLATTAAKASEDRGWSASTPYLAGQSLSSGGRHGAVAIIAIASNSSLCGAFNANVVKAALECAKAQSGAVTVYSIGKKMSEAMRRCGFPSPKDLNEISSKPDYKVAATLAEELMKDVAEGRLGKVYLVYNHFVSTARQEVLTETFLDASGTSAASSVMPDPIGHPTKPVISAEAKRSGEISSPKVDYIIEPSPAEAIDRLLPLTLKVRLFAALLDSSAAEHAARLVAMQTATDNGEDLLREITLEYNKARQQKITAEILDLAVEA